MYLTSEGLRHDRQGKQGTQTDSQKIFLVEKYDDDGAHIYQNWTIWFQCFHIAFGNPLAAFLKRWVKKKKKYLKNK